MCTCAIDYLTCDEVGQIFVQQPWCKPHEDAAMRLIAQPDRWAPADPVPISSNNLAFLYV